MIAKNNKFWSLLSRRSTYWMSPHPVFCLWCRRRVVGQRRSRECVAYSVCDGIPEIAIVACRCLIYHSNRRRMPPWDPIECGLASEVVRSSCFLLYPDPGMASQVTSTLTLTLHSQCKHKALRLRWRGECARKVVVGGWSLSGAQWEDVAPRTVIFHRQQVVPCKWFIFIFMNYLLCAIVVGALARILCPQQHTVHVLTGNAERLP